MKTLMNKFSKQRTEEQSTVENTQKYISIQQLINYFVNLDKKTKKVISACVTGIVLVLLIIITLLSHHENSSISNLSANENQHTKSILSKLGDIDSQVQTLSANPQNSTAFKDALTNISSDITTIKQSALAQQGNFQKLSTQIASVKDDMDSQMQDLKSVMANNKSKHYLDPKVLPFHVISVDVIAQQPFVSIDYDHHITPLAVGDSIAGWQITAADYDAAQVEFKNSEDKYVKVSLQG